MDVRQVGVADRRLRLPQVHRVDSLGQLGAAGLIDAIGVHPQVLEPILKVLLAGKADFPEARFEATCGVVGLPVLVADLTGAPDVREDAVGGCVAAKELPKLEGLHVYQSHCENSLRWRRLWEEEVEFLQLLDEGMDTLTCTSFLELQHQCARLLRTRYNK